MPAIWVVREPFQLVHANPPFGDSTYYMIIKFTGSKLFFRCCLETLYMNEPRSRIPPSFTFLLLIFDVA